MELMLDPAYATDATTSALLLAFGLLGLLTVLAVLAVLARIEGERGSDE